MKKSNSQGQRSRDKAESQAQFSSGSSCRDEAVGVKKSIWFSAAVDVAGKMIDDLLAMYRDKLVGPFVFPIAEQGKKIATQTEDFKETPTLWGIVSGYLGSCFRTPEEFVLIIVTRRHAKNEQKTKRKIARSGEPKCSRGQEYAEDAHS